MILGGRNVPVLAFFYSASEKDNDRISVLPEVDAVARSEINPPLVNAGANTPDALEITLFDPDRGGRNPGSCHCIEALEPVSKGAPTM